MPQQWAQWGNAAERWVRDFLALYWNEWTLLQVALIALAWVVAQFAGKALERRLERWARGIRGNPDLLRLVITTIRRSHWVVFVGVLFVLRLGMIAADLPDALVATVLLLAAAWLVLSVLTRLIRNRTLAQAVAAIGWIYVAVLVLGLGAPVGQALDYMAISIGEVRISALLVIRAALVVTGVVWLALFVSHVIEGRIARADDMSASGKVLFSKLIRIVLVIGAGAFALTATGVDLTALTVISGAVGVGIGFGLQKVVSNFISGILILLDRSVKPGDTIEVGETFGWITELRARFVSVVTRDGRKYLIPNEDFITQQVINWSYSDQNVRIDVEFGVSYDADPHRVTAVAIAAAKGIARVSAFKEPVCWMTAFGDYALQFKLRFWINDPQNGLTNVRGQVLLALWDAFKAEGIEIPIPRQDVRLQSPLQMEKEA